MYFFERLALRFVGLAGDVGAAAHLLDGFFQRALRSTPACFRSLPDLALVGGAGEQEQLGGDVLVAALLRFLVGRR